MIFNLIFKKLRLSDPWNYKVPFLISVPYFLMLATKLDIKDSMIGFGCSISTIIGIAGFGYLLNDYTDRKKDLKVGKENALIGLSMSRIFLILLGFLVLALLPWGLYFPMDKVSVGLLMGQFVLFILYSSPPFRFKERGVLGVLCDAGYAHVVPALLAAYTFYLIGDKEYDQVFPLLITLGAWQFVLGVRNILLHQIEDLKNDQKSETRTLLVSGDAAIIQKVLERIIVPLELVSFFAFGLVLSFEIPWFFAAYLVFVVFTMWKAKIALRQKLPNDLRPRLYIWLDDFYVEWIGVIILLQLIFTLNYFFLVILACHFIFFKNTLKEMGRQIINYHRA